MHPRTCELSDYLDRQRAILRAAFESVPSPLQGSRPAPDRWSVAEIIQHLSIVEERIGRRLSQQIAEAQSAGLPPETSEAPILPTLDLPRFEDRSRRVSAPDFAVPTIPMTADEAWDALEESTKLVREALRLGDGYDLGALNSPHPRLGQLSVYHWFAFIGAHEGRHAAQIRELAAAMQTDR